MTVGGTREPFDRAILPPDLRAQKYLWKRTTQNSWSDAALRTKVLEFLNDYLDENFWAVAWGVVEKFAAKGTASITEWKRRTGTSLIESEKGFLRKRGAYPTLVLSVTRVDGKVFEIGLPFPQGSETGSVGSLLEQARHHFEQRNRDE